MARCDVSRPEDADIRSPGRFLWWLVARQRGRIVAGATLGSLWMVSLALPPYLLGQAIDEGLEARNASALAGWTAAFLGTGVVVGVLGIARHRTMTKVRMDASNPKRPGAASAWTASRSARSAIAS
jgi:ABC-type multidrug transport system fused ATPase/permease subunit